MATGLPPTVITNPDVTTVQPGSIYPTAPIEQPVAPESNEPVLPPWRPGQFLRKLGFNPVESPFSASLKPVGSKVAAIGLRLVRDSCTALQVAELARAVSWELEQPSYRPSIPFSSGCMTMTIRSL